jgi:hypothetical protein
MFNKKNFKMNLRKLIPILIAVLSMSYLTSCSDDDPDPCTDQTLRSFAMVLTDEDDNLIMDEEGFDTEKVRLFALDGEEESEVDFEVQKSSEDEHYIYSSELSELSLEEGNNNFRVYWSEEDFIDFNYEVTSSDASGCIVYAYTANHGDDQLETMTVGTVTAYVLETSEASEE